MKVVCHLPIHPREGLEDPYGCVHNALCGFLLQAWPTKELLVCDDPGSKFDIDRAIAGARKACEAETADWPEARITPMQSETLFLGNKRNLMMRKMDGDVAVFMDDDDVYLPAYLPTVTQYLMGNPQCPGSLQGSRLWVYFIRTGRYGPKRIFGGSNTVLRVEVMRDLLARGLGYPEERKQGSDTGFANGIKRYTEALRFNGTMYEPGTPPTEPGANNGRAHDLFDKAVIPRIGEQEIVLRLPSGHTCPGWNDLLKEHYDRRGEWLLSQVPSQMRPTLQGWIDQYQEAREEVPMKKWVMQAPVFQLGNFVILTPTLQALSAKWGRPVPVFFANKHIEALYQDAPFLEILTARPGNPPLLKTGNPHKRRQAGETDAACYYRIHGGDDPQTMPAAYVDRPDSPADLPAGPKVAVIHGCLGHKTGQAKRKTLPLRVRQAMLDEGVRAGMTPVLLGNEADRKAFWNDAIVPAGTFDMLGRPIREQVGALAACDLFITNDTGLAHVAGALKVPGLILWKKSHAHRFQMPYPGVEHVKSAEGDPQVYLNAIARRLEAASAKRAVA